VHLLGVAFDSHTKSPQELIRESTFENADRCSPRLLYQMSSRIDSGVKFSQYSKCRLMFPLDPVIHDQIYFIILFSSTVDRWKQIPCTVSVILATDP
jgi:hypothetical protein